ncbi:hypothetical protein HDK77DRAFT_484510 [Phyllosticta capitalensis]|uniref:Uncharacterized protein n=1 Tax=Phyllosticta capitalensis TaxID=121624 RepID=A0ABR1YHN8_9PEZI
MKLTAFLATIVAATMAAAAAVPAPAPVPEALLQKRCLAKGVECIDDVNNCCDGYVCAENKGLGTLTCGGV